MNREDIIRMALEAGAGTWVEHDLEPVFERFAALLISQHVKETRPELSESMAEWLQQIAYQHGGIGDLSRTEMEFGAMVAAAEREACARLIEDFERFGDTRDCAAAIRARGGEMDYDEALHISWVDTAMVMAYDFAEAYCNHQCDDQQDRLHELNTARRALREHLINQPASMSLTDPELRAGIELQRREIDRLREAVAAEREACAKVCEETTAAWTQHLYNSGCVDCAAAIRARGDE